MRGKAKGGTEAGFVPAIARKESSSLIVTLRERMDVALTTIILLAIFSRK